MFEAAFYGHGALLAKLIAPLMEDYNGEALFVAARLGHVTAVDALLQACPALVGRASECESRCLWLEGASREALMSNQVHSPVEGAEQVG